MFWAERGASLEHWWMLVGRGADHSIQVGKSGKTVSPGLYFACGVSGATHHIMGMDTSKVVVAINTDPNAIMFEYADYGITRGRHTSSASGDHKTGKGSQGLSPGRQRRCRYANATHWESVLWVISESKSWWLNPVWTAMIAAPRWSLALKEAAHGSFIQDYIRVWIAL